MFESAELGHSIDKDTYRQREPELREALLDIQYELKECGKFPVLVIVGGLDGAGRGETVNLLNAWMDPRLISSHAFGPKSDEESERPHMWRFWRSLPPKGHIGIHFGSWYIDPIAQRVNKSFTQAELDQRMEEIVRLEKMLSNEGVLLLKFWFHLSKKAQRNRLQALQDNPLTRWRVMARDAAAGRTRLARESGNDVSDGLLQGRDAAMLFVFGALPPAVLNFLFAERYRQEPERVASIVLIGNLAALVFLPLALALVLK